MLFDRWFDLEKSSLHRMSDSCNEILNDVKNAVNQTAEIWQTPASSGRQPAKKEKKSKPVVKIHPRKLPRGGKLLQVLGTVCGVLGGISFLVDLVKMLVGTSMLAADIVMAVLFTAVTVGGIVLAVYGRKRKDACKRYRAYLQVIGNQEAVSVHAVADALDMGYLFVMEDFQDMILRGILSPAWLDLKRYRLMLTEYTGEIPAEKKEECLSRSERILQQIRADNDLIADEEVSAKIDRIEDLTRKIFAISEEYPEKEKQLHSFLNYYLPTTLKALESYARLEAQGVETQTIRETKQKINEMLDDLCDGYTKQLDRLFENEAVDITADIEVLRKMMQRDGLTEDEFTKK